MASKNLTHSKKVPMPILDDDGEYSNFYTKFKKNEKSSPVIKDILDDVDNPFKFLFACLKYNEKESRGDNCHMLLLTLQKLKETNKNRFLELLDHNIQNDVFDHIISTKKLQHLKLIIVVFELCENSDRFVPRLHKILEDCRYKEVAQLVNQLNLHSYFSTEDLLLPLLFLDQINLIESFLELSPSHQLPFLKYIDAMIGEEINQEDILNKYHFKQIKPKFTKKLLCSTCVRLIKSFGIDSENFPHTKREQYSKALHYLCIKFYKDLAVTPVSFHDLADDIIKDDVKLQIKFVNLLVGFNDVAAAPQYVERYKIPLDDVHHRVLTHMENGLSRESYYEEYSINDYFQLDISPDNIHMTDTIDRYNNCMTAFQNSTVFGIDIEWKPSFCSFEIQKFPSLVQFAVESGIYLLDISALIHILNSSQWGELASIFTDPDKVKLVYDFSGDKKGFEKINKVFVPAMKNVKNVVDLHKIKMNLKDSKCAYFEHESGNEKGLSELVQLCFGKPINKIEQVSLWTKRPLTNSQIHYASLDAQCLVDVYNHLESIFNSSDLPHWKDIVPEKKENDKADNKQSPNKSKKSNRNRKNLIPTLKYNKSDNEVKIVCDTMIQGLTRLLRHCGIDTLTLDNDEGHDRCIAYYEQEGRIVLSRGSACDRLAKYIPESHIYKVQQDNSHNQLKEVINSLNLTIHKKNVFTRCAVCNAKSLLYIFPRLYNKMKKNVMKLENQPSSPDWVHVRGGRINLANGRTGADAEINVTSVPSNIIFSVDVLYVCNNCGKTYWDGSHYEKVWNLINCAHSSTKTNVRHEQYNNDSKASTSNISADNDSD